MDHLREQAESGRAAPPRPTAPAPGRRTGAGAGAQAEGGRAASERLTDQARRQQEAGRAVAQESAKAYMDFLNTAFSQYREGTQRAAESAREGARTLSR